LADEERVSEFQRGDSEIPGNGREVVKKFIKGLAPFDVVQQSLKRNASAAEHRSPAEDIVIFGDDLVGLRGCLSSSVYISLYLVQKRPLRRSPSRQDSDIIAPAGEFESSSGLSL